MKKKHKILVGTHHKSGSAWMKSIFQSLSEEFKLRCITTSFKKKRPKNDRWEILLDYHSQFDFPYCNNFVYKGVHLVRDPRDIIISGTFYHSKSKEKWLHKKHERYAGLTYQEKINSYELFDDKIIFEMENSAIKTLSRVASWKYDNPSFFEVKYEDLIMDTELMLFHKMFTFLGFAGGQIPNCLDVAYKNSIFSNMIKKSTHVRSGKSQQWQSYFKKCHKKRFLELYGNLLIDLGYEPNHDWAN
ncbi:sulfotransferase family protein [Xenococcus sp. PCC 7305]|uniref:sulfotransferase domain-containing protein n=1 Tax=Xenococcus sp. PCC 7305 TaxID=102125 RepID=UPI0002AC24C9|nr:sulfotransferase domain-containing protein [Xenococcus sp. PCC 7305]ELS03172.1 sulfotransferase family protein [Xenococcus sp. PCC 7305]